MAAVGLVEGEVMEALGRGGAVTSAIIVGRMVAGQLEHVAYLRTNWRNDYLPLKTWGHRSDRLYRDLDRLIELLRSQFGYGGCIYLYQQGDLILRSYGGISEIDLRQPDGSAWGRG